VDGWLVRGLVFPFGEVVVGFPLSFRAWSLNFSLSTGVIVLRKVCILPNFISVSKFHVAQRLGSCLDEFACVLVRGVFLLSRMLFLNFVCLAVVIDLRWVCIFSILVLTGLLSWLRMYWPNLARSVVIIDQRRFCIFPILASTCALNWARSLVVIDFRAACIFSIFVSIGFLAAVSGQSLV